MVQGIKFLTKKSFNPTNLTNQKQVWERQQQEKEAARKTKEREKQLQKERDDALLAQSRGEISKVSFLYEPPPGMVQKKEQHACNSSESVVNQGDGSHAMKDWAERQPGDDDAAAAFRLLLAGVPVKSSADPGSTPPVALSSSGGTVLQGTTYDPMTADTPRNGGNALSALEKAVGKRPQHSQRNALSLDEQIQRFPSLANAPRVAGIGTQGAGDTSVTFKPLGAQIRNVRCLVCGTWGHSKGDRECAVSGWDPFATRAPPAAAAALKPPSTEQTVENAAIQQEDTKEETRHSKLRKHHRRRRESDRSIESSSYNSSDESSVGSRRRSKHKKKRRKNHKSESKRRRYDSSDDASDSEDQHRRRRHKSSRMHRRR